MLIIPAIDLYQGKVVRLTKGDPSLSKIYSDNPLEVLKRWEEDGAKLVHVVDLSAALGQGDNAVIIKDILKKAKAKVQIGGGIRSLDKARELISLGAERVIIGTKGIDESFLNSLISAIGPEKIALGVDVVHSNLAIDGWKKETDFNALDFIAYLQFKGIKWVIYTDISRDGTLGGVDLTMIKELSTFEKINIIVSGGVSSLKDLKKIKNEASFVWGVIAGKALYEGKIDLRNINIDNS
jgi:phosphoribosylformimino-5-aminoimidazole carboxamide ribotide isomerase